MENRYGYYRREKSIKSEEFQEEDVWGIVKERKDSDSWTVRSFSDPVLNTNRLPTAARMMSKSNKNLNSQKPTIVQHSVSAPVDVPDWSKIYATTSKQSSKKACSWLADDRSGEGHGFARSSWENDDDEDEDEEGDVHVIPPHEFIARKLARNQISSFSVCEGAGRTLKGRDLSRVRNAVLTKTGFLESKNNQY